MKVKTFAEAQARYGQIKFGKWADESKWMMVLKVPEAVAVHLTNIGTGLPCRKIYCNTDMFEPLTKALNNIIERNLCNELETFDGCYQIRLVRGGAELSTHSYGLAIDINAKENQLGAEPKITPELVKCFTDEGFDWGGDFSRKDGMHFSFAWEAMTPAKH